MIISLIVAMGNSRQIGKDNKLLWHISEDLKNFKKLTMGKTIIMGRKTYDSIGFPLPGRKSIVVTRNQNWSVPGVKTVHSLSEGIEFARSNSSDEIQIIGGGTIYGEAISFVNKIYLSYVDFDGEADTFFPEFDMSKFKQLKKVHYEKTNKSPSWDFVELEKEL